MYLIIPPVALTALLLSWQAQVGSLVQLLLGSLLVLTVYVAVHHAETVALRVGEPFGTLVLAVAVTVIEVGMIVVLILDNPEGTRGLARDTVFSAIMITTNAIVGSSLLVKTLRVREASFRSEGVSGALAALAALSIISLVLPSTTISSPGQTFTPFQLAFAAVASLTLYLVFVAVQTIRHRDFFLPPPLPDGTVRETQHVKSPSNKTAVTSFIMLMISLISVVGLAKVTSPLIQSAVSDFGLPQKAVAVSIAIVVLLPEWLSALRAARYGRTQTSLNLAYGSALASIGLTIPVIAVISVVFAYEINLGLNTTEINLLLLTLIVSALTVVSGKATLMQAAIHLGIFSAFLMVVVAP
jgi:Ca2+:H+ antiporter